MTKILTVFSRSLLIATLTAALSSGQTLTQSKHSDHNRAMWRISVGVLLGSQCADLASSWNRPEANPLLRTGNQRFGAQGFALKAGLTGSVVLAEYFLSRKDSRARSVFTKVNFGAAALLGGVAIHNEVIAKQNPAK